MEFKTVQGRFVVCFYRKTEAAALSEGDRVHGSSATDIRNENDKKPMISFGMSHGLFQGCNDIGGHVFLAQRYMLEIYALKIDIYTDRMKVRKNAMII